MRIVAGIALIVAGAVLLVFVHAVAGIAVALVGGGLLLPLDSGDSTEFLTDSDSYGGSGGDGAGGV